MQRRVARRAEGRELRGVGGEPFRALEHLRGEFAAGANGCEVERRRSAVDERLHPEEGRRVAEGLAQLGAQMEEGFGATEVGDHVAPSLEHDARQYAVAAMLVAQRLERGDQPGVQRREVGVPGDVAGARHEAYAIQGLEDGGQEGDRIRVDLDEVGAFGARLGGFGAAALQVAGVDDPRIAAAQDLALVDMAECPVVHAGRLEV